VLPPRARLRAAGPGRGAQPVVGRRPAGMEVVGFGLRDGGLGLSDLIHGL
jgi:hypothetical protein